MMAGKQEKDDRKSPKLDKETVPDLAVEKDEDVKGGGYREGDKDKGTTLEPP